jgi:hypothetical protein
MSKLYFTEAEINQHKHPLTEEVKAHVVILIAKLSDLREIYGRPMIVTSGFRSRADQEAIYKHSKKVPYGSAHLSGRAADVADRDGSLAAFCYSNIPLLEKIGLWCEDPTRTRGWVHFQTYPPVSGNRFFMP